MPVLKSGPRVLVADNERLILRLLRSMLAKKGLTSHLADTGEAVLEECQKGGYSLLLLDLELGAANGLEIIHQLRSRGDRIPVILMSGTFASDTLEILRFPEGVLGLAKPFDYAELERKIDQSLGKGAP